MRDNPRSGKCQTVRVIAIRVVVMPMRVDHMRYCHIRDRFDLLNHRPCHSRVDMRVNDYDTAFVDDYSRVAIDRTSERVFLRMNVNPITQGMPEVAWIDFFLCVAGSHFEQRGDDKNSKNDWSHLPLAGSQRLIA